MNGGTRQLTVGIYSYIADDDDDADEDCDNANLAQTFFIIFHHFSSYPRLIKYASPGLGR